jgi:hypothetical protein
MKITKKEFITVIILTVISYVGHYYLSWHCTLSPEGRYVGKFIWITGMIVVGYIGLLDHEITWVAPVWLVLNCLLVFCFGIDKLLGIHYHQAAFFRISSYQFTSPIPYIAAFFVPRLFISQYRKHIKTHNNGL